MGETIMSGKPNTIDEHRKLCRALCESALKRLIGPNPDLVSSWWNSPNKAFDDGTPEGTWQIDYERVYRYIMSYASRL